MEVFECRETNVLWHRDHWENWGKGNYVFDIFPYLLVTNFRKNQFPTLLSHLDPLDLVFWKTNKLFLTTSCSNWGFGFYPPIWNTLNFGVVFGQIGFLALPYFKYPFLENEERNQIFGRIFIATHPLICFRKLRFADIPKTVIGGGGVQIRMIFRKTSFFVPQWKIFNFGSLGRLISVNFGGLKDLLHSFHLSLEPSKLIRSLHFEFWK